MTQSARNPPTSVKVHPRCTERKTGTPTTNQMSRAPKRKNRAADSTLIARVFDSSVVNLALLFVFPISVGSETTQPTSATMSADAIAQSDGRKPMRERSNPPRKNPAPFNAFFDPVRIATHLKSDDFASAGTR